MSKKFDNEDGVWRTIGGRRVFIRNGQDLASAMKESGKFKPKYDKKMFANDENYMKENEEKEEDRRIQKAIEDKETNEKISNTNKELKKEGKKEFDNRNKNKENYIKEFNEKYNNKEFYNKETNEVVNAETLANDYIQYGGSETFEEYSARRTKGLNQYKGEEKDKKDHTFNMSEEDKEKYEKVGKKIDDLTEEIEQQKNQKENQYGYSKEEWDKFQKTPMTDYERENFHNENDLKKYQDIKKDTLEYYTEDFGWEGKKPEEAFIEQMEAVKDYKTKTPYEMGKRLAEGGNYLVANDDMEKFLEERGINPNRKGDVFDTYTDYMGQVQAEMYNEFKGIKNNPYATNNRGGEDDNTSAFAQKAIDHWNSENEKYKEKYGKDDELAKNFAERWEREKKNREYGEQQKAKEEFKPELGKKLSSRSGQESISKDTKVMRYGDDYLVLKNGANKGEFKSQSAAENFAQVIASNEKFEVSELKNKAQGILPSGDIDTHEGDLYIKKTKTSEALLNNMKNKDSGLLTTFKDQETGETWYDVPFANMSDDFKEKTSSVSNVKVKGESNIIPKDFKKGYGKFKVETNSNKGHLDDRYEITKDENGWHAKNLRTGETYATFGEHLRNNNVFEFESSTNNTMNEAIRDKASKKASRETEEREKEIEEWTRYRDKYQKSLNRATNPKSKERFKKEIDDSNRTIERLKEQQKTTNEAMNEAIREKASSNYKRERMKGIQEQDERMKKSYDNAKKMGMSNEDATRTSLQAEKNYQSKNYGTLSNNEIYEEGMKFVDSSKDFDKKMQVNRLLDRIDRANKKGEGYSISATTELRKFLERENAPFNSKRVAEADIREKGYQYFSTHGIGPGTTPNDVRARELDVDLPGGWVTFKTDRPLTQQELDYYGIQPETRNRELRERFKLNEDNTKISTNSSMNDNIRKAYQEYKQKHPNSKMTFDKFKNK